MLNIEKCWYHENRLFASWDKQSRGVLQHTKASLHRELAQSLRRCCTHIKGHGGVKGNLRLLTRCCEDYHFVARFDVARYYESMQHEVLLDTLLQMGASTQSHAVVEAYLQKPDVHGTGVGMTAGGCLSPLLGAVMLTPLDDAMTELMRKEGIVYIRFMDDFIILAKTRHPFRRAIKRVHEVMRDLQLQLHEKKRFIGKVSDGFDFLGYTVKPGRRLRPSAESIRRLSTKFRRLYERGASPKRLWRYVVRWCGWLWGGLDGLVSRKGGTRRVFVRLLRLLDIAGFPLPDMRIHASVNEKELLSSSG